MTIKNKIGGQKYVNKVRTLSGKEVTSYLEIPFAIFSEVKGY